MAHELIPFHADNRQALHALVRKRAELAGQIERHQAETKRLFAELDHVDATIGLFAPDLPLDRIKVKQEPPKHAARKGELTEIVLRALRESGGPLVVRQLVDRVIDERGLPREEKGLVRTMIGRVRFCLRWHKASGLVRSVRLEGAAQGWEMVRITEAIRAPR
ncbi:MAG TPA: hypothetical protein VG407_17285 [Caulobacteraceae bacterium]|jgi:hypothetical protein|nr:hypothetical protein [Caulobacteraceae bacterium]